MRGTAALGMPVGVWVRSSRVQVGWGLDLFLLDYGIAIVLQQCGVPRDCLCGSPVFPLSKWGAVNNDTLL